jgi:cobalamin biosynthesis Co2+ chelatase CbiK
MTIVLYEKLPEGQLLKLSESAWDEQLIQALNVANFILVGGKEYEMIEGRLNLDLHVFELLLVKAGAEGGGSKE